MIYSPTTSVMDTKRAMELIKESLVCDGVTFTMNQKVNAIRQDCVETDTEAIKYDYLINAAGLDSLRLAQAAGHGLNFRMVPFKGRYAISTAPKHLNMLVYPVPEEGAYVLGVHSTLTTDGYVKVGPTIFPAFANENYDFLQAITPKSLVDVFSNYARLLTSKDRGLIWYFIRKELLKSVSKQKLISDVNKIQSMEGAEFKWYKAGIRPQLFCLQT